MESFLFDSVILSEFTGFDFLLTDCSDVCVWEGGGSGGVYVCVLVNQ